MSVRSVPDGGVTCWLGDERLGEAREVRGLGRLERWPGASATEDGGERNCRYGSFRRPPRARGFYSAARSATTYTTAAPPVWETTPVSSTASIRRQITGVSSFEAVCKVEQICQVQRASVEAWEGDMEWLGPVGGDRVQPVVRPR
ncbi:hypothetical protein GCM10010313_83620 [Streptomyces violarus]|nr:hypothetical protein GCM10010313_83620 [Streptomyces violarus]